MTGLRVGSSGVWIPTATRHFAPNRQDNTWGSRSLFCNEDRGTFPAAKRPVSGFDLSPPAEVETEWSYACVPPLSPCLHGAERQDLPVTLFFGGEGDIRLLISVQYFFMSIFNLMLCAFVTIIETVGYIRIMKANELHNFSDLFHKVLYMFRTGPLFVIRSISALYTRNRYLSC